MFRHYSKNGAWLRKDSQEVTVDVATVKGKLLGVSVPSNGGEQLPFLCIDICSVDARPFPKTVVKMGFPIVCKPFLYVYLRS